MNKQQKKKLTKLFLLSVITQWSEFGLLTKRLTEFVSVSTLFTKPKLKNMFVTR